MTDDGAPDGLWDRLDGFLAADEASRAAGELAQLDADALAAGAGTIGLTAPDDRLVARFKAAWCTRPLHALEQSKGQRGWERFSPLELGLLAIDIVVEQMELSDGADPEEVRSLLARAAGLQVPGAESGLLRAVADGVLGALLEPLEVTYGAADASGAYVRHRWTDRLMEEIETFDGRFQLRASHAAVNILVGALDLDDLESAMAATTAALESLIKRGRLGVAERRAQDARRLSKTYAEDIRRLVAMTERSVRSVSWDAELRPQLQRAYAHLEDRVSAEAALAHRLEDLPHDLVAGPQLASISDVVQDCLRRHRELHAAVMSSQTTLLDRQAEQAFRAPPALRLVDLDSDVLRPLLDRSVGDAGRIVSGCFAGFVTARPPRVPGLAALLLRLLQPEKDRQPARGETIDDSLPSDLADEVTRFSAKTIEQATAIMAGIDDAPASLASLLAQTDDPDVGRVIVLLAAAAFDPELVEGALMSVSSGTRLTNGLIGGDDLTLHRLPRLPRRERVTA